MKNAGPLPRLLVLEDEESTRAVVVAALRNRGYRVAEAHTLSAARKALKDVETGVLLCDIHLGDGESGLDLLREIAFRSPELAIVMMTGVTDTQIAVECLREGALDYITKPFTTEHLLETVARTCERQQALLAARRRVQEEFAALGRFSSENPNPVLRVSRDGVITYANRASEPVLHRFDCRVGGPVPDFLRSLMAGALGTGERRDLELEAAGRVFSFAVVPVETFDDVFLYGHDVSPLKETERALVRLKDQALEMALHDPLTRLPNRVLLEDRLQQALAQSERNQRQLAVAFLDLDGFKQINDTRGHRAGDDLLVAVAACLRGAVRKTDTVARWGGDEMILLLPDLQGTSEAQQVCDRIRHRIAATCHDLTVSIGIALYPEHGAAPDELLHHADAALFAAKAQGRNTAVFFTPGNRADAAPSRVDLRKRLAQAIAAGAIDVHYQPIMDVRSGRVASVEALARWSDPEAGTVSPSVFIPLAEQMGGIGALARHVFERAAAQFNAWKRENLVPSLSFNLSIRQLFEPELLKTLLEITARHGLHPSEIVLEMTESQALLGLASEEERLAELAQAGFGLSIDDFGQGHSSLSSVHTIPVSELKIDAQFTRTLQSEKGRRVMRAIVEMARALGLRTVVEGIETDEELSIVAAMNPDRWQGYFFTAPRPAAEATAFLERARLTA